ncbi:TlpA family protein disulfide reductase [Flavobacterium caeni]|uniref:Peroxiredoxin n=1 Tax=Flavobacterium caeni TaxID=490189 RepID=A0A1G5JPW5_9FLAO|nr:TlpA disulfide reductase family protein [Flavobacterium caeni]SCY89759.1 Peroxiredoxin [Flavobacterium caeni]
MKKILYLLFLMTLPVLAGPTQTIVFSGKISNSPDGVLKVRGESFEKDIKLKPDGSFSEKLDLGYNGSYLIASGNNRAAVYLTQGMTLALNADHNDFYKTIKFSGKGSMENQYIASKNAYVNAINQQKLYVLDETEFLKEIQAVKKDILVLFDAGKFPKGVFAERERKNIDYLAQIFVLNYGKNHAHFAQLPDFKPSESFDKIDPKINLDSEADFLFSNPYKQLINLDFNQKLEAQLKPEDQFLWKVALPEIKKYKSQSIRNALAYALTVEVSGSNPEVETLYNELLALSTNPHFKKELTQQYQKISALKPGGASPAFNYENHKGGTTSLESLKGKYVYIDVWATWCGPCIREIPALQKVEKDFHGKNIEFVSISIDAKKDHDKWKKMVTDRQMGGIQLMADNDWNSQFVQDYGIMGIPRFILLDPDGKIVNADAPRPSDPALLALLAELKI